MVSFPINLWCTGLSLATGNSTSILASYFKLPLKTWFSLCILLVFNSMKGSTPERLVLQAITTAVRTASVETGWRDWWVRLNGWKLSLKKKRQEWVSGRGKTGDGGGQTASAVKHIFHSDTNLWLVREVYNSCQNVILDTRAWHAACVLWEEKPSHGEMTWTMWMKFSELGFSWSTGEGCN